MTAQQSSSSNKAQEQSSSTSTASESNLSPQQLGTLVALYQDPDWFKEYLKDGIMYYGTEDGSGKEIAGYNYRFLEAVSRAGEASSTGSKKTATETTIIS